LLRFCCCEDLLTSFLQPERQQGRRPERQQGRRRQQEQLPEQEQAQAQQLGQVREPAPALLFYRRQRG
jgi:hypothetical protein